MQPLPTPGQGMLIYTADQYDGSWLWLAPLQDLGARSRGVSGLVLQFCTLFGFFN